MTGRPLLVALGVFLLASTLAAQVGKQAILSEGIIGGVITDGVNQWEITGASSTDGAITDFEVPIGTDHQFSNWWWYRVAGDSAETIMPPPDIESYVGDTATLTWNNVDGRGLFSAELEVVILNFPPGSVLLQILAVQNISGANLDLQVFAYTDMDLDASAGNDSASAVVGSPSQGIDIVDISQGGVLGFYPDGYRVDAFSIVRDALNDAVIDDFADTGLPFGPGDYTGAFQWGRVLADGELHRYPTLACVNAGPGQCVLTGPPIFADGFETGDTVNWDGAVQ